ncbi:MAG: hypothetical protein GY715_03600 [Planctomycetes bacterium]|nr:hypothetical protein [Planctomycetota bacterium]
MQATTYHDPAVSMRRITVIAREGSRRAAGAWDHANAQPSWILRTVLAVLFLLLAIPLLVVVLIAIAVVTVLFVILAFVNRALTALRNLVAPGRDDEGRENVRVIRRD